MPNPCNSNPCSQLCLLNSESGYTCACTVERELNPDQRTCRGEHHKNSMGSNHKDIIGLNYILKFINFSGEKEDTPSRRGRRHAHRLLPRIIGKAENDRKLFVKTRHCSYL